MSTVKTIFLLYLPWEALKVEMNLQNTHSAKDLFWHYSSYYLFEWSKTYPKKHFFCDSMSVSSAGLYFTFIPDLAKL